MNPTIIIADDHPLVLKGLQDFLIEKKFNVLASAKNGKEALALIKAHTPDIAVLDIKMPFFTGLEIAEKCKADKLPTKIILITFEKDEKTYNDAKALGAYGYILKEFALEEIENCIASVIKNKTYFSPDLLKFIELQEPPKYFEALTKHEQNIVKLISNNKTGVEIANLLNISTRTVEKHKSNIIKKLKLESKQNSLLIWAKENSDFLNTQT
ncbi:MULTISPECIES: response regulator transcription factor [Winogradskyella]|mgnify:CR=1 FL=1|uniref:Response regulator transcription factor n=1 Tax=Winogradskyella damuponensis TaxID=943939 RepID=A0ABP8CP57_9FLAO